MARKDISLAVLAIWCVASSMLLAQEPAGPEGWVTQQSGLQKLVDEVSHSAPETPMGDPAVRPASHTQQVTISDPVEPALLDVSPVAVLTNKIFQPPASSEVPEFVAQGPGGVESRERLDVGVDLYSAPDFEGGLIIYGEDVAMKIGGYVKADFIYDFDPIDSTDAFVTTQIPVGADPRKNSRFHARQTRLSFDTRWASNERTIRIYVEGDFFSESDRFRLRHAYGEVGPLVVGRTWTTFTDIAAAPATLDFEGSVSSIARRQAIARWTQPILCDWVTAAVAVEETRFIIETPVNVSGEPRSPTPDFVARMKMDRDWGRFQVAGISRVVGFQPDGYEVLTSTAWGFNFTGVLLLTDSTKGYYQIVFGEGIGSYRDLPDAAPVGDQSGKLLPLFGWMAGITHEWTEQLSSNFTYAENRLENTSGQASDAVHETTYLAANLLWHPLDRVTVGIEYLYGTRQNVDRQEAYANRLQAAFIFDLP